MKSYPNKNKNELTKRDLSQKFKKNRKIFWFKLNFKIERIINYSNKKTFFLNYERVMTKFLKYIFFKLKFKFRKIFKSSKSKNSFFSLFLIRRGWS